jgi:NAD(P) transhydrogenase
VEAEHYDLVVIGSGPAGEKGAAVAAYHGRRVVMVERRPTVGGTAVNTGGIPTKALRDVAVQLGRARRRITDGLTLELDLETMLEQLRIRAGAVSAVMADEVAINLDRHAIEVVHGQARLGPGRTVSVATDAGPSRTLHGDVVLIATGSHPVRPPTIPFDGRTVVDSDEIVALDRPFRSVLVVGAGAVGCEYASIFAAIGMQVCLVDAGPRLLPVLDAEVAGLLRTSLCDAGIDVRLGTTVTSVAHDGDGLVVALSDGTEARVERLLFAAGRAGNTGELGLHEAGVELDGAGRIVVDARFRTTADGVLAAGDVLGPPGLASVSMEQARVAVSHAFGFPLRQAVDRLVPVGIYAIPEVAAVGLTEEQVAAAGLDYEVGRGWMARNTRAVISGDTEGVVKLVFERAGGRLLGVHILGAEASELVHLGQAVIRHGGTIDEFVQTTFNVPTRTDAYKYAAYDGLKHVATRAAFGDIPGGQRAAPRGS